MEEQTTSMAEQNSEDRKLVEMSREELVKTLKDLVANNEVSEIRDQVDSIKQLFYKKLQEKTDEIEIDDTENEVKDSMESITDDIETEFKAIMALYKEKKAALNAKIEEEQEANYKKKKEIIAKLETLVSSTDDLSEKMPIYKELKAEWKNIGQVAPTYVNELWKEYNHYQEQFYDLININAALREYDFKKNLEIKTTLIEQAIALDTEEDIVKAFQTLQKLHEQWRETGPVARELRDEIWNKFKNASSVINRKHQMFFEMLKAQEQELTEEREKICKYIEEIDTKALTTYKQWEDKVKEVIATNEKFRPKNPVERKVINKIYKRYREACNNFFAAKNEFYKEVKESLQANYEKKRALVEKAEQLKNSTDWTATTNKLIALQKEWKTIGPVAKKYSDAVWEKFTAACDHFFAEKEANLKNKKEEETENLKLKLKAIEAIKTYEMTGNDEEDFSNLKHLSDEFLAIGHVPFKDKDKVYNTYREVSGEKFGLLRTKRRSAQLSLSGDKNRLMRQYESLKQQIATYENNIGFFSNNNKKGNSLLKELERKIQNLKDDLAIIENQLNSNEE